MFRTLYVADGAGLAADQVGAGVRLFGYDCLDDEGVRHVGHVVDPAGRGSRPPGRQGGGVEVLLAAGHAFGATLLKPLMMRSIASPPVGSVRLARSFRVNFISMGWLRPRWAAICMTFGLPMSFTKARPRV